METVIIHEDDWVCTFIVGGRGGKTTGARGRVVIGLLVGLFLTGALIGVVSMQSGGVRPITAPSKDTGVSASATSLSYDFLDFFNVPYGEWWDYRFATYGDLPINADCFNATSITDGICVPSNAAIPDSETYPYTNWYPLPGNLKWDNPSNNPMVYAPYRLHVTGMTVPGYNRSEPVFLPVLNYAQPAGNRLDFDWRMNYLDKATGDYLTNVVGCPSVDPAAYDGFYIRSQITLAMDLQESKRIFNVVGTDQSSAQSWWNTNTNSACGLMGPAETNVKNWFLAMGGGGSGSAGVGKYDIANSFEWYYTNWYLQMTATVDADGTTHVSIDHAAWGTEVMLSRMFYWGNTSYKLNYLDSSKATGWWGMELAWFEDFSFAGSLGAPGGGFNFGLNTAMQYHFQHQSSPGPNGLYDRTDDVPFWTWGPILTDYTNDYFAQHPASELDRYPSATYIHSTPGGYTYGQALPYDYAPIRWDLAAGQSWHFQFPTGDVIFYDPNVTPVPANPQGGFVAVAMPLDQLATNPASYGTWNGLAKTWDVVGPSSTGGPAGTPGTDGVPGTADDQYALAPWGSISLGAAVPMVTSADLIGRSAWPERHHFVLAADSVQTLFGKVANLGNSPVTALVEFNLYDSSGALVGTFRTGAATIGLGGTMVLSYDWTASLGKYSVTAQVLYDSNGDGTIDAAGAKVKSFGFSVVP